MAGVIFTFISRTKLLLTIPQCKHTSELIATSTPPNLFFHLHSPHREKEDDAAQHHSTDLHQPSVPPRTLNIAEPVEGDLILESLLNGLGGSTACPSPEIIMLPRTIDNLLLVAVDSSGDCPHDDVADHYYYGECGCDCGGYVCRFDGEEVADEGGEVEDEGCEGDCYVC